MNQDKPTVLFCGGGTMGPVTPLLAVLRAMKKRRPDLTFAWAGTPDGPERQVVRQEGVPFYPIPVAKLPRYPSVKWLSWPFMYMKAVLESRRILKTVKPSLVASAGGYSCVPVIRAASSRGVPCAIHQLDAEPGLSNKTVARLCASVTTSFKYEKPPFFGVESQVAPTPCRFSGMDMPDRDVAVSSYGLDPKRFIVFVMGGGTGASALNDAVWSVLDRLLEQTQVIHMTGKGKGRELGSKIGYKQVEFLDEKGMLGAYAAADLVISRAGMGGISDCAALRKSAIFVPIPGSHQETNLDRLVVEIVRQGSEFAELLLAKIFEGLHDEECRRKCGERLQASLPTDDGSALAERWMGLI